MCPNTIGRNWQYFLNTFLRSGWINADNEFGGRGLIKVRCVKDIDEIVIDLPLWED